MLRLIEVGIILPLPMEMAGLKLVEGTELPVYIRLYVDASREDRPDLVGE
jgi:hypothetical protein